MCGIVGYIGKNNTNGQLLDGLKRLEYRGYDSAGIAVLENGKLVVTKAEGKLTNLEKAVRPSKATCGIGHTRWATHGKPTVANAHPHTSQNGEWAVVHNGIIENYVELKNELLKTNKIKFKSTSDSEIIPQMFATRHNSNRINILLEVCKSFQGSFAIACINKNEDNTIYLAKRKMGLYIAQTENEVFIASDPSCFAGKSEEFYALGDNEFCKATNLSLVFYNQNGDIIHKEAETLQVSKNDILLKDNENFMYKEILETPNVLKRIVETYQNDKIFNKVSTEVLKPIKKIYIIGCGTAYHSGLLGERYLQHFAQIDSRCFIASEFQSYAPIIDKSTLCIFVSQSGETADTLACLEYVKQYSPVTLAITNVNYSSLARKVDFVFPILAGPEIAVASTKAYSAQSLIFLLFAKYCQNVLQNTHNDIFAAATAFADSFQLPDLSYFNEIKNTIKNKKSLVIIGRNYDYVTAQEGALKIKEVTYIDCCAFPSGELKHGYIAMIDHNSVVISVATEENLFLKCMNANSEVICRGAKVFLFSQFPYQEKNIKQILLPKQSKEFMPIVSGTYFQILAYVVSKARGIDPDKPRNLAKSVTVE